MQPFEAPRTVAIACFYISVFLFFEMAWEYCKEMLYPTAGRSSREKGQTGCTNYDVKTLMSQLLTGLFHVCHVYQDAETFTPL